MCVCVCVCVRERGTLCLCLRPQNCDVTKENTQPCQILWQHGNREYHGNHRVRGYISMTVWVNSNLLWELYKNSSTGARKMVFFLFPSFLCLSQQVFLIDKFIATAPLTIQSTDCAIKIRMGKQAVIYSSSDSELFTHGWGSCKYTHAQNTK